MEDRKRSAEEALAGSASSHQRIHRQKDATCDVPIIPEQGTDSTHPLGSSSAPICRQLPCYPRRPRDNNDLIASIDRTSEKLADCLSIAESALAIVQGRSPPEANPVRERLAKAEARIAGETFTIIFYFFLTFILQDPTHLFFKSFRSIGSAGKPSFGCGPCGRICQC